MNLILIYSLKQDHEKMKNLQEASSNLSSEFGLEVTEYGLVGAPAWWNAIDKGKIPQLIVEGGILRVYKTGHNDFSQFDVESNGEITSWMQYGNQQYYRKGNIIKITYVLQNYKKPLEGVGTQSKLVLRIEAEEIDVVKEPYDGFEMI